MNVYQSEVYMIIYSVVIYVIVEYKYMNKDIKNIYITYNVQVRAYNSIIYYKRI